MSWPKPYTMRETLLCLSMASDCLRFSDKNQAPMPPTAKMSTMKIANTNIKMELTLASAMRKRLRLTRALPFLLFEDACCAVDILEPDRQIGAVGGRGRASCGERVCQ